MDQTIAVAHLVRTFAAHVGDGVGAPVVKDLSH